MWGFAVLVHDTPWDTAGSRIIFGGFGCGDTNKRYQSPDEIW